MSDSVVGHVDGRVRQRLNNELFIPRDARAQTSGPGAAPLLKPVEHNIELMLCLRVIALEAIGADVLFNLVLPGFLAVVKQPLVAQGDNAAFIGSCSDRFFRLIVRHSEPFINHLLTNNRFGILDALSSTDANLHHALVKASLIALVLGLIKLHGIFVRLDFHLLDDSLSTEVTKALNINERDWVEALDPLKLDTHALTKTLLGLQIAHHGEIVRRIRWHGGDDSGALGHTDGGQRQNVDVLVRGHRSLDLHADELCTGNVGESRVLKFDLGHLLMSKVPGCSLSDNEKIVILHLVNTILALRQHEAVGLTVHGLRTQGTGDKEDVSLAELLQAVGELQHADLDASVLLDANTLTSSTIVISARLALSLGEDCVALAELDLVVGLEVVELPADELVVVGVLGGSDEVSPPVRVQTQAQEVLLALRREEIKPVGGIDELGNLSLIDAVLQQDFVLGEFRPFLVLGSRLFLSLGRLVAARFAISDLTLKTDSGRGDWHASAMESEGEQGALSQLSLIARHELSLRHRIGVSCKNRKLRLINDETRQKIKRETYLDGGNHSCRDRGTLT